MENIELTEKQIKEFRRIAKIMQAISGPERWSLLSVNSETLKLHVFDAITTSVRIKED